jgi:uncharacterized protein (TIGR03083 family)
VSIAELLSANDARLLHVARGLDAAQWAAPSLCTEWTNHQVLAHLVAGYRSPLRGLLVELRAHHWSFDAANTDIARRLADVRAPDELIEDFARCSVHRQGIGRYFPRAMFLGDHVTHELDICHALGLPPSITSDALVAVLNLQVRLPNPFVPAFRNSRGLRLTATDADWSHGSTGPAVRGPAAALVSVLASRPRMLTSLAGDGVVVLAGRVGGQPPEP